MRLSVYMKFSASYTENQDNSTEQGRVTLVSDKLPYGSLWLESCPKSLCWPGSRDLRLCKELYDVLVDLPILFIATTFTIQQLSFFLQGERGEKNSWILSTSLLNCQILFIRVRKRCSANINTSDISVLQFTKLQVQSMNKYPCSSAFLM